MNTKVSIVCTGIQNLPCVNSLLDQSYDDLEIILDKQINIVDERIKISKEPSGEYIVYTDMQCCYDLNAIAVMLDVIVRNQGDIIICGRYTNGNKYSVFTTLATENNKRLALMQRLMKNGLFMTMNNTMIKNRKHKAFEDMFCKSYQSGTICAISNAFVLGKVSQADHKLTTKLLEYFLKKGIV